MQAPDQPSKASEPSRTRTSRRDFVKGAVVGAAITPIVAAGAAAAVAHSDEADTPIVMADMEKYRALGGWIEKPEDLQPKLQGMVDADVVVIGGGFAGLTSALELRQAGASVVVLEREFCGFGASGRNAGYLAGAGALEYDMFLKRVGDDVGRKIVSYYDEAVSYAENNFKQFEIDCDYVQSGVIRAAVHPSQEGRVRDTMETGHRLGHASFFLDGAAMRERGIPPAFLFGDYDPKGGTLHPGKYVLGLRRAALNAGIKIFENTPMLSIEEGKVVRVRAPLGSANGRAVIFATNAYTPGNGLLQDKVVPIRVSAIETEPLTAGQLESLGWPRREGIVTPHYTMESYRLTSSDTVLVTTKTLQYAYGSRTPNVPSYKSYGALRQALHDRLPTLKDVALKACWSGYISLANDFLPVIGVTGANRNILYTAGCSGHGVASQSLVGMLLAQRVRGITHPILAGIAHETPKLFPEPLRWCIMNSALTAADAMDERLNRRIRRERDAVSPQGKT